ncbi:hypothetical protein KFL_002670090 [Klebsormidium nitens]|uniref:Thioredoxin domain-containing protein n=1 Tax=Klebsormidium nitens TaxID=105231 RepID=A0A1Y1I524_KLENI|nr:hypothetical protein KFL_002670090 [Klebsormidium nitens]|eukprot:GAQ86050.1 hypothetical protein KFL_002670090 [Klebsormidium nitens]
MGVRSRRHLDVPAIIFFTASSFCGPCRDISSAFARLEQKYLNINFFKVDVDAHSAIDHLSEGFGVVGAGVVGAGVVGAEVVGAGMVGAGRIGLGAVGKGVASAVVFAAQPSQEAKARMEDLDSKAVQRAGTRTSRELRFQRKTKSGAIADGVAPEDVHKGENHGSCQGAGAPKEERAVAVDLKPAPSSVVISWVFDDVFRSKWGLSREEKEMREVQLEAHAERLGSCWEMHGDDFTKAFAEKLMARVESIFCTDSQLREVYPFLVGLFGACTGGLSLHVTRGSQELWPFVLEEFRRKHERLARGVEWAAPETTNWRHQILCVLHHLNHYSILFSKEEGSTEAPSDLRRAIGKVRSELLIDQNKAEQEQADKKAKEEREAREAKLKAKRQQFKDSLKRAPWDKEVAVTGQEKP